jgi:hypothetical protein
MLEELSEILRLPKFGQDQHCNWSGDPTGSGL